MPSSPFVPPAASTPPPYVGSSSGPFTNPNPDPYANRGAWYDPASQQPAQPSELGYSPGPALTPIDGGRGARFIGPILALIVLATVVGALVFVFSKFVFNGDDGRNTNQPSGTTTAIAAAGPTKVATKSTGGAEPTTSGDSGDAPTAAVTETGGTTEGGNGTEPTEEPTNTPKLTNAPVSALSMLPTTSDLPDGFKRTENDKRSMDAVAASFADPEEATANLQDWDWRENAYRTFEIPAADSPDPNSTTYINISIHRFGEKTGAAKALTYFADSVQVSQGLEVIDIGEFGDKSIALSGAPDGSNLVVLYIRTGYYLIRIGGSSPQGDPTQDVINLANKILNE